MDDLSPITATIKIELRQSGNVMVVGAIQDKAHALALVEAARDAIIGYHAKNTPIIIPRALN